jgi:hypothetical protein
MAQLGRSPVFLRLFAPFYYSSNWSKGNLRSNAKGNRLLAQNWTFALRFGHYSSEDLSLIFANFGANLQKLCVQIFSETPFLRRDLLCFVQRGKGIFGVRDRV